MREPGIYDIFALNLAGDVVWKTPLDISDELSAQYCIGCEDLNGDGVYEWAFLETHNELVIVSPYGEKIASLYLSEPLQHFLAVPQLDGYGLLVTVQGDMISAYQFERRQQ